MTTKQTETILEFLQRFGMDEELFADLAGISVDDLHALSTEVATPAPRVLALQSLVKAAGRDKAKAALRHYRAHETRWRVIPGFPAYEASDCGKIRRRTSSNFGLRVLKELVGRHGYPRVTLYDDQGNKRKVPIHRAVCSAWHGEPTPERNFACHRDGDPANNREDNLYWGTPVENTRDCIQHGRHRLPHRRSFVQSRYGPKRVLTKLSNDSAG